MCQKTQRPRHCDRWIKLPERAGRCVAGIGEYLSADVRLPLIEGREIGLRHIDFAPHLEDIRRALRSEEHTSELQSLMRISYAVFCLKKKKYNPILLRLHINT